MGEAEWVVARRRVVEELQRALVAAIAVIKEQPPVAACHVDRPQDHEVGGEPHQAACVEWRLVEVGDPVLRRRAGIDGKLRPSGQPLIGTDLSEFMSVRESAPFGDDELYNVSHTCSLMLRWPALRHVTRKLGIR